MFQLIQIAGSSVASSDKELGFKQSFLRGHSNPVGLIEVCLVLFILHIWWALGIFLALLSQTKMAAVFISGAYLYPLLLRTHRCRRRRR